MNFRGAGCFNLHRFVSRIPVNALRYYPSFRVLSLSIGNNKPHVNLQIVQQLVSQLQIADNQNIKKIQQLFGSLPDSLFQIPWGYNILIFNKIKDDQEAIFYPQQTKENNWRQAVLEYQIEINLYQRRGKAITNLKNTLLEPTPIW